MREESSRTHDVFLSYSSKDKTWADAACAVLERHRIRCWIAPRDITPGDEWGAAIIKGLNGSRIMVLIFSGHANASGQVRREVERAISQGMTVLPVRIEDVRPEGAMEYALGNTHWLDAFTPPVERQLELLARSVKTLLANDGDRPETQTPPPIPTTRIDQGGSSTVMAGAAGSPIGRIRRVRLAGLAVVVAVLAAVIVIPRPGPSRGMTPLESPPLKVETTPSVNLGTVKPADRPKPQPKVPDEPQKLITNSIGMKLVLIPAGEFLMGSTKGAPEEEPPHLVRITRPLFLGQYEVTQEEYEKVTGINPSKVKGVRNPVETVSWLDALKFCNMLSTRERLQPFYKIKGELATVPNWDGTSYRLPTEAEWEYACRAGGDVTHGFGDGVPWDEFGWFAQELRRATAFGGPQNPERMGFV